MNNNYVVYMHKNKINGKVYIGITSNSPKRRWDCGRGYKNQILFYRSIQKYNWDNFEHIILFENLSFDEACLKEQELIKEYKSNERKYGYNYSIGGDSGSKGSHWIMSNESREKDRIAHLGSKNGMYGKKGILSPSYGKHLSEETKKKLSESLKGRKAWNKGKKLTEEHKKNVSIATKLAMQRPEVQEKLHKPKKKHEK